jgi:NAD(P)-dependent dehydrogenase (short-subunit alcohol dehydrogenase family)
MAGASVVVTGRSSEAASVTDGRKETIEETARFVIAAGGKAYPYRCDHTNEREVDQLVAWTLRRFGRLDCLVGSVWGGNEGYDGAYYADGSAYGTPFWRRPIARLGKLLESGLYAQVMTAKAFAPAMAAAKKGLMVFLTFDHDGHYIGDGWYDLAQASIARFALVAADDLGPFGVTALALSPGHVRTERVVDAGLGAEASETPLYAGRAVAALLGDARIGRRSGTIQHVADLAREFGFKDADGSQPERFRPPAPITN